MELYQHILTSQFHIGFLRLEFTTAKMDGTKKNTGE
jgi:hypothetical protein